METTVCGHPMERRIGLMEPVEPWTQFYKRKYDEWYLSLPCTDSKMRLGVRLDGANETGDPALVAQMAAIGPEFFAGVRQMLTYEQAGGDGWWKGWEMLKAAYLKCGGEPFPGQEVA